MFRSLKSELGRRPVFHHQADRTDGHLFITVLAHQMVQKIRHKLAAQGHRRRTRAAQTRSASTPLREVSRNTPSDRPTTPVQCHSAGKCSSMH